MISGFSKTTYAYCLVALIATLTRLYFISFFPESDVFDGDGRTYALVAENILTGCGVSLSEVGSTECAPHFGGNQGPGYPAFIAIVWALSGHSDLAIRLVQSSILVISIIYLVDSLHRFTSSLNQALIIGIVLAISPLQIAWPRFFLTETLALAGTLWVFVELIKSLQYSKLRILPLGLSLIAVTFIRLDSILLIIPVSVAGFIIHKPVVALKRGLYIGLILTLPWAGWLARNYHAGLDHVFKPINLETSETAPGLFHWASVWSTDQYSSIAIYFPVYRLAYDEIKIDEKAYASEKERAMVTLLLEKLQHHNGEPFPSYIDDQFSNLALSRIKENPFSYFLLSPIKRIFNFWSNLNAGYGWPGFGSKLTAQDRLDILKGGVISKISIMKKYPVIAVGKLIVNGWKIFLYLLFSLAIWLSWKYKMSMYKNLVFLTLSFILARSGAAGWLQLTEARFSIMQMPIMELVVVLVITKTISIRKKMHFKTLLV